MAQPPAYTPQHSFVSDSATLANFPGQALDVEFNAVKATTDGVETNLKLIQRDDGALFNGIVTYDSLSASLQSNGLAGATTWLTATSYLVGVTVYNGGSLYRCLVAHTSGTFATDLAAGDWLLLVALPLGLTGATGSTGATGPGYKTTSTTSNTVSSSGAQTFTVGSGLAYSAGARVRAADSSNPSTNYMEGVVTSYSGTTLIFTADRSVGSGTLTSWTINLAGDLGATGATGSTGSTGPAGAVAVSGTPSISQLAVWTNATTVKGVSITGLVKGNGASDPAAAVSGTDYCPATSGSSVLKASAGGTAATTTADALTIGTIELGNASDTTLSRASAGVLAVEGVNLTANIPQLSKSIAYTTVLADANTHILHPSADTTARTWTIDSNANVAYPIGTAITFVNQHSGGVLTISITTDTMRLAGTGATGNRTLAADGIATALKLTATEWIISGTGLT